MCACVLYTCKLKSIITAYPDSDSRVKHVDLPVNTYATYPAASRGYAGVFVFVYRIYPG